MNSKERKAYDKFARTGFAIKGAIYVLLGTLAVIAAAGPGGKTAGRMGVLRWIDQQPFGEILLILIVAGLLGYVVLRMMQAIKDTNHKGTGWKGLSRRAGYFISGFVYLFFIVAGFYLLFPHSGVWKSEGANYIDTILHLPAGNLAVAVSGIFTFGYGVFEILRGFKGGFRNHLHYRNIKKRRRLVLNSIGAAGYIARGITLCLMGYFIGKAAFNVYVKNAKFTSQVFELLSSYFGAFMMGIIAAGLALYGAFMFVKAKFYEITTE